MLIKKPFAVFVAIAIISLITACSIDNGEGKKRVLRLYLKDSEPLYKDAVTKYNSMHKDTAIKISEYFSDQQDDIYKKISAELLEGRGPDIILFSSGNTGNISKLVGKDVLMDLGPLFKQDKKFMPESYFENVMEAGDINGKRYFIPLNFYISMFTSTRDILAKEGMKPEKPDWSWDELLLKASERRSKGGNGYFFDSYINFSQIMQATGMDLMQTLKTDSDAEKNKLRDLLSLYKNICRAGIKPENHINPFNYIKQSDMLKEGSVVLTDTLAGDARDLWMSYGSYDKDVSPVVGALPGLGRTFITAVPYDIVAISKNCADREAAFEFIRLLISDEYQESELHFGIPVSKEAYTNIRDRCLEGQANRNGIKKTYGGGIQSRQALQSLIRQYDRIVSGIDQCKIIDSSIFKIFDEEAHDYAYNGKAADDTIASMKKKIQDYLKDSQQIAPASASIPVSGSTEETGGKISIYYMDFQFEIKNAIRKFKETNSDIEVEQAVFPFSEVETLRNRLATEVMSGTGPDVIISSPYINPNVLNSFRNAMASGAFCDLNEFINRDKGFNMSDYNEKVMETGVYDGKRYFIPLNYAVSCLMTQKSVLDKYGIEVDMANWTWKQFAKLADKYAEQKNNGNISFLSGYPEIYILWNSKFINYPEKKSSYDSKEFIGLLNICKNIRKYTSNDGARYGDMVEKSVFTILDCASPEQLAAVYSDVMSSSKEGIVIYPLPAYSSNSGRINLYFRPQLLASINSNSKGKELSYLFIKTLISKEFQSVNDDYGNFNNFGRFPVNIAAYNEQKEYYSSDDKVKSMVGAYGKKPIPVDRSLLDEVDSWILQINRIDAVETTVILKIAEETKKFMQGGKTAEEAANDINSAISLYLNE